MMKKATFGKLLVAYLVDYIGLQIIGFVVAFIISFCVSFAIALFKISGDFHWLFPVLGTIFGFVTNLVYFAFLESHWGYSLGKKLMGLQVVQDVPAKEENK